MKIVFNTVTKLFSIENSLKKFKIVSTDKPHWIQNDETPKCPYCSYLFKPTMKFIAQYEVGSDPVKFTDSELHNGQIRESKGNNCTSLGGDSNNMYLFECPKCGKKLIVDQCY